MARTYIPGRDSCTGACETEAGCMCSGLDQQGRLTGKGKPLPIPPITRMAMRQPGALLGLAAVLVTACAAAALLIAQHWH
jgi:hypothetical protein